MENLEILKGIVSDETYAALEAETKDSKIRLGDLSTDEYALKKYQCRHNGTLQTDDKQKRPEIIGLSVLRRKRRFNNDKISQNEFRKR